MDTNTALVIITGMVLGAFCFLMWLASNSGKRKNND